MITRKIGWAVLGLSVASMLLGCSATAPTPRTATPAQPAGGAQDLRAAYTQLARAGGTLFALSPKDSTIRIFVFRAGSAAKLGHNHVLSAPRYQGYFFLPPGGAAEARFDLEFRLDELELDNPDHRAVLGPAFASKLAADAIAVTREHMLGADNLQADRFPFVRIHSLRIAGEAPKFAARVAVELHGRTQEFEVPLNVTGLPQHLEVGGSLVLRQSEFGVQPYSVLNGVLAVRDEVVVDFKLVDAAQSP